MTIGKAAYLKTLTAATIRMNSVETGTELAGSSPPSVFIGSSGFPKLLAGPMITPVHGDTAIMDQPEEWISRLLPQEDIIRYRMNLVRGKHRVDAKDLDSRFITQLREIAMADTSIESDATFSSVPTGISFSEEHAPYGPSAEITSLEIENTRWNHRLEKVYSDTDLVATDAIMHLHRQGIPFSTIQKAFSVGTMGRGRDRHLVPTRWSITACDSTIANRLYQEVKTNVLLDTWRVHEFSSLNNRYTVILMPTGWQYEWTEAFVHVLGNEELVFSDHEIRKPKTTYSPLGGCYYSCKMAVLEALARERIQAGAIVLREAQEGYVPLGVFNVRENVRSALRQPGIELEDAEAVFSHIKDRFTLPASRFEMAGKLLRDLRRGRQTTLSAFS